MSQPKKKRRIMTKAFVTEISAVDRPAQENALVVLRKRDDGTAQPEAVEQAQAQQTEPAPTQELAPASLSAADYDHALTAAESLAKGAAYGRLWMHLGREEFQAAQVEYVKRHTRPGETETQATVRLMHDPVVQQLDRAWRETQHAREAEQAENYLKARAEGRPLPEEPPRYTSAGYMTKADIDYQLRSVAETTRRPGESIEQAYARALRDHPELYAAYREASD